MSKILLEKTIRFKFEFIHAKKYISSDQLIIAPDCGLGHLPKKLAILKLKRMVEAVKK